MAKDIFVVYSRRDLNAVRALAQELAGFGHTLWVDVQRLTAADDWPVALRNAIRDAPAVLVCGSSEWTYDFTFATTELALLVEAISSAPAPCPVVPIRFNRGWWPSGALHAVDWLDVSWTAPADLTALHARLETPGHSSAGFVSALAAYVSRSSPDALRLRVFLRQHWSESFNYVSREGFPTLISLWEPMVGNPFFLVDHDAWQDDVEARCGLHSVKCMLFQAHTHLGASDFQRHVPLAHALLQEIVAVEPYVESEELDADRIRIQNLNYRDTLAFTLAWFDRWGALALGAVDVPETEIAALEARVRERKRQLDGLPDD